MQITRLLGARPFRCPLKYLDPQVGIDNLSDVCLGRRAPTRCYLSSVRCFFRSVSAGHLLTLRSIMSRCTGVGLWGCCTRHAQDEGGSKGAALCGDQRGSGWVPVGTEAGRSGQTVEEGRAGPPPAGDSGG